MSTNVPLSLPIDVRTLPPNGEKVRIDVGTADATAALAKALGVDRVETLTADLLVEPWAKDGVSVKGEAYTEVVQACVVSLEPVASVLREQVDAKFAPPGSKLLRLDEQEFVPSEEPDDPPEEFDGTTVDVGALVVELLSLAVDPYPRAPDAELPGAPSVGNAAGAFAALAALKNDQE